MYDMAMAAEQTGHSQSGTIQIQTQKQQELSKHIGMISTMEAALVVALLFLVVPTAVHGHGYLLTPRSRNFVAWTGTYTGTDLTTASGDGSWSTTTAENPAPESEPQSANRGGTNAQCGITGGSRNYDYPKNAAGGAMTQPNLQACYQPGSEIDIEVVLTAHHKGHFELKACPLNPYEVPTKDCFDKPEHKLTFVSDELYGAPPDVNHPERAYIPPSSIGSTEFKYKYLLPANVTGDFILLQWYYITANTCTDEGYDSYPFPAGWEPSVGECPTISADGTQAPEQVSEE